MLDTFFQFLFPSQSSYLVQKRLILLVFPESCTGSIRRRSHVGSRQTSRISNSCGKNRLVTAKKQICPKNSTKCSASLEIGKSIITHEDSSIVHVTFDRTTYIHCIKKERKTLFSIRSIILMISIINYCHKLSFGCKRFIRFFLYRPGSLKPQNRFSNGKTIAVNDFDVLTHSILTVGPNFPVSLVII